MTPALLLAVTLAAPPVPKPGEKAADWFPHAVGTKWTYRITEKPGSDRPKGWAGEVTIEVLKADEKDGVWSVEFQESRSPTARQWQTYTVSASEVVRAVGLSGHKLGTTLLKAPLKAGDSWAFAYPKDTPVVPMSGTVTVKEAEEVEVPAGKYRCVPVEVVTTHERDVKLARPWVSVTHYAKGVGVVKWVGRESSRELTSYTPPKK